MATPIMDGLDQKLTAHFAGRVVRKDLVRQTKTGFNVPVYVLEYLLGKYCSSTDPEVIAAKQRFEAILTHLPAPEKPIGAKNSPPSSKGTSRSRPGAPGR